MCVLLMTAQGKAGTTTRLLKKNCCQVGLHIVMRFSTKKIYEVMDSERVGMSTWTHKQYLLLLLLYDTANINTLILLPFFRMYLGSHTLLKWQMIDSDYQNTQICIQKCVWIKQPSAQSHCELGSLWLRWVGIHTLTGKKWNFCGHWSDLLIVSVWLVTFTKAMTHTAALSYCKEQIFITVLKKEEI